MSDSFYISAMRSNAQGYEVELNELRDILKQRNWSKFEYRACE